MLSITYNISQTLKDQLAKIDSLRREILLTTLSPQIAMALQWQATIAHLEGWATLANQPLTREHILSIVSHLQVKNSTPLSDKVLRYKNSLNYIQEHWQGQSKLVTFETIKELSEILGVNHGSKEEIEGLLNYLQSGQIHPSVQAALAHLSFYPSRLAYIVSYLFLAKAGYHLHGWLSLEDCWSQNKAIFLDVMQRTSTSTNSTAWIEFFCQGIITQMGAIKEDIAMQLSNPDQNITKDLNIRQKAILDLFITITSPLTNRQVQKEFGVSQITASRDLAKLSIAGLIAPHGAGRSTSYTKI